MKISNLIYTIALTILFACNLKLATGQATSAGPFTTAPNQPNIPGTDFLGWDNTVNVPLMIRHDNNKQIEFYTDGLAFPSTRMIITPGNPTIGGGRVGIGYGLSPSWQLDVNSEINIDNPTFSSGVGSYMLGGQTILTSIASDNLLIGFGAGLSTTGGIENIYIGTDAGNSNIATSANTFMGFNAGMAHIGNGGNTFLGWYAGRSNFT